MRALIDSWSVKQLGPALSTRREERNEHGDFVAVSYEAINEVTMRVTVVGNDGQEFVRSIQELARGGAVIKGIEIAKPEQAAGRKYVFE